MGITKKIIDASTTSGGLLSATDKTKLDSVEQNANYYEHPTTSGNKHIPSGGSSGYILKFKEDGEAQWSPETDTTYNEATSAVSGLMSKEDKTKLDGIDAEANKYVHPSTTGNKHIPSGGVSGQILRWSSDGTAAWGADNDTTYSNATTTESGLMSASDKLKLNGIDEEANKYEHPTTDGNKHIPSGGSANQVVGFEGTAGTGKWVNANDHRHTQSQITDFAHTHEMNEVTGLASALSGKAASSHTHSASDISGGGVNLNTMISAVGVCTVTFPNDTTIQEVYSNGTLTTVFNSNGTMTKTFVPTSGSTVTTVTTFGTDGTISEVIQS